MPLRCFPFPNANKSENKKALKLTSGRSSPSTFSDQDVAGKLGPDYSPQNNIAGISSPPPDKASVKSLPQSPGSLRVFAFAELKVATRNFSRALLLGEGGFGPVYRGVLRDGEDSGARVDVAVKQLSIRGFQGHKEWVTEVNVLGIVEHPNLVKLIGYCEEEDERGVQRLLVYEYMPNRSVHDHLSGRTHAPLSWAARLRIAQDAARGLAYLHEGMEFQIIFRDLKSSNILLDDQWNAKLSDFGLARLGPADGSSHVSTAVVGTIGYTAPEYIQTGRLTSKSDMWSYGIFLYELITGRRPLDRNRPKNEQKLLDWVRAHLSDMKKFEQILDPQLDGRYEPTSTQRLAAIANRCLVKHPRNRPRMSEVLEMVNGVVKSTVMVNESPVIGNVERSLLRKEDEKFKDESWTRRFFDNVIGDGNMCLGLRSSTQDLEI